MNKSKKSAIVTKDFDTERIILTSENSPEVAAKIKEISKMLMEKNKEAYAELAKMP